MLPPALLPCAVWLAARVPSLNWPTGCASRASTKLSPALSSTTAAGINWVNDERYGAMAVRSGAAKGHGPIKIRFELRRKGLDDGQIETAFDQPELDWFELALALLERRARASDLGDFKLRMKWLKYLLGRGFNQDQARYAIATMMESETQDG
ncbi:regulatory protein RecX [Aeromonas salmonicida subsp. salmonicida A449]|uniref:Regulatory protein RecX n=1 Tax=Aeromonas salmonicida (strain A449) TaxID=382245 RepID=A4SS98_AERS4|nr:regulatory protein RecX [Aeromonas salmonicida subsp. salmonicida A449]